MALSLDQIPLVNQRYARSVLSRYLDKNMDGTPIRDRERVLAVAILEVLDLVKQRHTKRSNVPLTKIDRVLAGMLYAEFLAGDTSNEAMELAERLRQSLLDWANIDEDRLRYLVES